MYNTTTNHGIGQIPKYSFIVYCRCEIAIYHEYYLLIVMYKVDDVVNRIFSDYYQKDHSRKTVNSIVVEFQNY